MNIEQQLSDELGISIGQIKKTVVLIDEGNTIPFIARYRKEVTGGLDDQVLRELNERLSYIRSLADRQNEVIRLIEELGQLDNDIREKVRSAVTLTEIDDLYRPFRPKRRTKAVIAKEKGLDRLAETLKLQAKEINIADEAQKYSSQECTAEEALQGAMDIIAEEISDHASYRKYLRTRFWSDGMLRSENKKEEESVYETYYSFEQKVCQMPGHRILAVNRGEKEGFLSVELCIQDEELIHWLEDRLITDKRSSCAEYIKMAAQDSYKRLIRPSIVREIRNMMTEAAEENALKVFASNLKGLLLQPPLKGKRVLALDPGYRTGCKLAVTDQFGKVLRTGVIYPTKPQMRIEEAETIVFEDIKTYSVDVIAIGNGTATKETEIFVADLLKKKSLHVGYIVVSEAGASVYSASELAAKEFPEFDVALRSAVSIGRRLQDPLAELVKIDPKSIGVGQYQHDLNQKRLGETLGGVVEDCVNSVGVDINTASWPLLSYVAGIGASVAKNIVDYREENGPFAARKNFLKVKKLGAKAFEQCAGFLRIPGAEDVLDNTAVHPESYEPTRQMLNILGYRMEDIANHHIEKLSENISSFGEKELADKIGIGVPTLKDIVKELMKPGRDPRDELPKPELRMDVLDMEDLKPEMILTGTIRNVADFGAFVDIGVHQDGLVHISQIADKFIKHPSDVVRVGDIVKVKILSIDFIKKRISLTMKI